MPHLSIRELKRTLQRFGVNVEELSGVEKVEILMKDKKIVVDKPQILYMKLQNQHVYYIFTSTIIEEAEKHLFSDEDVEFVVSQTGVAREKAVEALKKSRGDIAEAIILIKEGRV